MLEYLVKLETPSFDAPKQFMSSLYDQFSNNNEKYKHKLAEINFIVKSFELLEFKLSDEQILIKLQGENILYKKTQGILQGDAIIMSTRDFLDEEWDILPKITCNVIEGILGCGARKVKVNKHKTSKYNVDEIQNSPKILQ